MWRSVERAEAVPRPAKPARQNVGALEALGQFACSCHGRAVSSRALPLRKVCRAGFAGRGTPSALTTGAAFSLSGPDPRRSLGSATGSGRRLARGGTAR